ncbi:hypothetical protein I204_06399 [Kwoniella mangroviensis CBS 8886]|uniref:uncharacterized protein n=1 Tax=Kwoniella mangroviensis CBS 8507 TaxID=1296122 RepID=UPI00080D8525|nr:uncharacterized protein I203_06538 [Kwoniella mangroviensis CBS 8507]OCF64357.1 hypothetical protein I203_06538 [Kwoniella mangroviensis CBS 8507]OCF73169.1 hypothetical protein I204_06399 [Kwoniella mangroviensis CBS 8886]
MAITEFPSEIEPTKKRSLIAPSISSVPSRSSKRQRAPSLSSTPAPITRVRSPSSSEGPSTSPKKGADQKEPDHSVVRLWFLNHLSKPYPTLSQKETLATKAGITRNKVDSDLTNFRRRAGWTDLMNRFCGGDRDKMKRLIERVESGREQREEVLKSVQRMKDYLGRKEEERVGDWVKEVTALTSSLTSTTGSTTSTSRLTLSSSDSSSTISHNRSITSLSEVSNLVKPTARSLSGSSSTTSSSLSDTSMTLQPTRKRLNPNAEVFVPNKRYAPSATSSRQSSAGSASEVDARLVNPYDPSIWSTTTSIPLLPHMSAGTHNTWAMPRDAGFQPRISSWSSNGSVSRVSRAL